MSPTAFGSLPLLAVPVVILGPLAFSLGVFALCAFWLFGSALPLGIFAPCAFWLFGLCLFWFFFVVLGSLGSSWGPLAFLVRLCPLCLVVLLALPFLAFFVAVGPFRLSLGALWSSSGRLCPFVPFGCVCAAPCWSFLLCWGLLGSPWGLLALFWAFLRFVPFGSVCPALLGPFGFFCVAVGSSFWAPWRYALFSCVPFGLFFGFLPFLIVAVWPPVFLCL